MCWSSRPSPASDRLNGVAFGNHTFVVVGDAGTILRSGVVNTNGARFEFPSCDPSTVRERDGQIVITVQRAGARDDTIRVRYSTADGTAVAGQDYQAADGILTFAAGQTEQSITLQILKDNLPEGTEAFTVLLHSPMDGAEVGKPDSKTIQILDDDSTHLDHWVQSVPQSSQCCLQSVAHGSGTFVAVGYKADPLDPSGSTWDSVVVSSTDGQHWQEAPLGVPGFVRSVCWGGSNFVAVGSGGILSSPNGSTWREAKATRPADLANVCYGNGLFVAVGSSGPWTSVDGVEWAIAGTPTGVATLSSVAWGNGVFVALGGAYGGNPLVWTNAALLSVDGTNWTAFSPGIAHALYRIAYGDGLFVAAGSDLGTGSNPLTATIATSRDGVNWTQRFVAASLLLEVAAYVNGSFLVIGTDFSNGSDRTTLLTSTNGTTWSFKDPVPWSNPGGVVFGDGLYVMAGGGVWTSTDTVEWQEGSPASVELVDITYGGNLFVAVGSTILTSPDGNRWTTRSHTLPSSLVGVTYGKDRFAAVAADGGVLVSGDGIDWTNQYLGTNTQLKRVAFGNETFVAIGGLLDTASGWWTNRAFVSPDALHWTQAYADSTSPQPWVDITFGNNLFVAVAWDAIFTSPDGASWTARTAGTTDRLNAITYGNGMFVAVGGTASWAKYPSTTSIIVTSPDGVIWTSRSLPREWSGDGPFINGWPLTGVVYGGGTFVAVGTGSSDFGVLSRDIIVTSSDGAYWNARPSGSGRGLSRIATGSGRLVAVGENGRVLRPGVVLSFMSPASASDHVLTLSVSSEIGLRQEFQVSTNLVHWSTFTNLTNTNFRTEVVDPKAGVSPRRFYRAKEMRQ